MPRELVFRPYKVTLFFQYPAWDEKDGIPYEIDGAKSKSDAIKQARHQARRDGHCVGGQGRYWFKAEEKIDD